MANNDLINNENILVKVDQNNLIYIDPNSVLNNGQVEQRGIKQENLMMYVNLEADIIPRSILVAGNDKNTVVSIAKGTLNMMSTQPPGSDFDTSWTNAYDGSDSPNPNDNQTLNLNYDGTAQSFGIDSVSIISKGYNAIPEVTINFIDVRGKTLFESPENSPYKAFFHLPWPIFYLTVKGFYGKAIRYRLHLVKFSAKFSDTSGNFEIVTSFVGSTYAYLTDIPLTGILNAPYMYLTESVKQTKINNQTGFYDQVIKKSSKGYSVLSSIYDEYKEKGLIAKDFPVKTLRELIVLAGTLDKILERVIFDQVGDMRVFVGVREYEKSLSDFEEQVLSWSRVNLNNGKWFPKISGGTTYYYLSGDKTKDTGKIKGSKITGTLDYLIETNKNTLNEKQKLINTVDNKKTKVNVSKFNSNNHVADIDKYIKLDSDNTTYGIAIDTLIRDIHEVGIDFVTEKNKLEQEIQDIINKVVKTPEKGIGFDPTIRNIFAVILANAETYIRLLKDVHNKAFERGPERKKILQGFSDETPKEDSIYPWPEVKKSTSDGSKHKVVAYPGDKDLSKTLKTYDKQLWPEIDFVENFQAVATKKYDALSEKEGGIGNINFVFKRDEDYKNIKKLSPLLSLTQSLPYSDTTMSSVLYELYERSYYLTNLENFDDNAIENLVNIESDNLMYIFKENNDILDLLKKISDVNDLYTKMAGASPFNRLPYLKDALPTTQYIELDLSTPFSFEELSKTDTKKNVGSPTGYDKVNDCLLNYEPSSYRNKNYPFNSSLYRSYLGGISEFSITDLKFGGVLNVDTINGFISSPNNTTNWVKKSYENNLFSNPFKINGITSNILNTPYFHKQLISDYSNQYGYGKYVGSSYLLLNSLPFIELEDKINITNPTNNKSSDIRISSLFREIGSTHFIPYHLLLKWGSIYHRYKKFINDGVDILSGVLNSSNVTSNFDGGQFFDGGLPTTAFTVTYTQNNLPTTTTITHNGSDIGVHPFYDSIYSAIVNGYSHYDVTQGDHSFSGYSSSGNIISRPSVKNNTTYWSTFMDNSKYVSTDNYYTLLPSDGNVILNSVNLLQNTFEINEQNFKKTLWGLNGDTTNYSGVTFPSYKEYNKTYIPGTTSLYGIDVNYKKVIDLIGTFSPKILDQLELYFLEFSSEKIKEDVPFVSFSGVHYPKFQDLFKEICTVDKTTNDSTNVESLIKSLADRQQIKLNVATSNILSNENVIKFTLGNPKEIDPNIIGSFVGTNQNKTSFGNYDPSQLTLSNLGFINLYIGEDVDGKYLQFFITNDVQLNEENIIALRPLVLIFAGQYVSGYTNDQFKSFINLNVLPVDYNNHKISQRHSNFLRQLFLNLQKIKIDNTTPISEITGYNDDPLKLELYNTFKSFNDKWIGGNSIGQRNLLEEFLFLDKSNKDIGDQAYFDLAKLIELGDSKNSTANLYSVISMLIAGTGFDMRALPAYVNFYGANVNNKTKVIPSKKVANNLFGTFLEVDYQESSPKVIIQYVGPTSKHLDLATYSKEYKFSDDSFYMGSVNNHPLIITAPEVFNNVNLYKSNRVVAFEVSFGDIDQSMFKGYILNQTSIKNTSESFAVMENLARSESGAGSYQIDIGLFDIYRQSSYTCTVTCMGNVMLQPTMYFYLKNIPMFKGSYWIMDVSHYIKNNNITTTFTGTRIPYASLPDPKDTLMSSYKPLFDSIINKVTSRSNISSNIPTTETSVTSSDGISYPIDPIKPIGSIVGEKIVNETGVSNFGIPYNGFNGEKYIQYVNYNKNNWFRATVVGMGTNNYPITPDTPMSLMSLINNQVVTDSKITFGEINKKGNYFYSLRFTKVIPNDIIKGSGIFLNPANGVAIAVEPNYQLDKNVGTRIAKGAVHIGPPETGKGYGIGLSETLKKDLGLNDGDIVYFMMK